jgi:hypothetical protein
MAEFITENAVASVVVDRVIDYLPIRGNIWPYVSTAPSGVNTDLPLSPDGRVAFRLDHKQKRAEIEANIAALDKPLEQARAHTGATP